MYQERILDHVVAFSATAENLNVIISKQQNSPVQLYYSYQHSFSFVKHLLISLWASVRTAADLLCPANQLHEPLLISLAKPRITHRERFGYSDKT